MISKHCFWEQSNCRLNIKPFCTSIFYETSFIINYEILKQLTVKIKHSKHFQYNLGNIFNYSTPEIKMLDTKLIKFNINKLELIRTYRIFG